MHAAQRVGARLRLTLVLLRRIASTAWKQEPDFTTAHRLQILAPLAACRFRTDDHAKPQAYAACRFRMAHEKGASTPFFSLYLGTFLSSFTANESHQTRFPPVALRLSFATYGSHQTRFPPVALRLPVAACCFHHAPGRITSSFLLFIIKRCPLISLATYGDLQTQFRPGHGSVPSRQRFFTLTTAKARTAPRPPHYSCPAGTSSLT